MLSVTATLAGGKQIALPAPLTLKADASYEIPADSLEATFPHAPGEPMPSLIGVQVRLDGGPLFDGLVDEQELSQNAEGTLLSLRARSRASLLLDNEALPQVYAFVRLTDLYRACAEQYGFSGLLYDRNPMLAAYPVSKGSSEWQALELFCRQTLGLRPYMDGNYLSARPRTVKRKLELGGRGERPVAAMAIRENRYGVISKVILKSPITQRYDSAVLNPRAGDLQLKRKRYIVPPGEWNGALKAGADRMMRDSMVKRLTVSVTLPGLVRADAGDRVRLHNPGAPSGPFMVYETAHRLGGFGSQTTLLLVPAEDHNGW